MRLDRAFVKTVENEERVAMKMYEKQQADIEKLADIHPHEARIASGAAYRLLNADQVHLCFSCSLYTKNARGKKIPRAPHGARRVSPPNNMTSLQSECSMCFVIIGVCFL